MTEITKRTIDRIRKKSTSREAFISAIGDEVQVELHLWLIFSRSIEHSRPVHLTPGLALAIGHIWVNHGKEHIQQLGKVGFLGIEIHLHAHISLAHP